MPNNYTRKLKMNPSFVYFVCCFFALRNLSSIFGLLTFKQFKGHNELKINLKTT